MGLTGAVIRILCILSIILAKIVLIACVVYLIMAAFVGDKKWNEEIKRYRNVTTLRDVVKLIKGHEIRVVAAAVGICIAVVQFIYALTLAICFHNHNAYGSGHIMISICLFAILSLMMFGVISVPKDLQLVDKLRQTKIKAISGLAISLVIIDCLFCLISGITVCAFGYTLGEIVN
jgi:ABC-type transport system involved in cytochrome c biogenesis permease subunit